jgi:hypothetical protein
VTLESAEKNKLLAELYAIVKNWPELDEDAPIHSSRMA